ITGGLAIESFTNSELIAAPRILFYMKLRYTIFIAVGLLFHSLAGISQNVTKAEYYIDTDPGFGNAVNIPIASGTDVTASFQVNLNAQSSGFHQVFVRAFTAPFSQNDEIKGGWSLTSRQTYYKEAFPAETVNLSNIIKGEYFVDTDPGFGNGSNIAITQGTDLTNVSFSFNVISYSDGFHRLYIRFKDADGKWSLTQVRMFYKQNIQTGGTQLPNIVQGEYFVDTDPGFGNGSAISFTPGTDLTAISFSFNPTAFNTGFHRIYTRFKDANGQWSLTNVRAFYKDSLNQATALPNVVAMEYFIDTDPGFGNGTPVSITPSTDINNLVFDLDMSVISIGNHRIYVRAKDAYGKWSLTNTGSFTIDSPSDLQITIGEIPLNYCAGVSFDIPFTVNNDFGSNNVFTAQLSNRTGSFNSPVNIGNITAFQNDTIRAVIPANAQEGDQYRIRIIANSP